MTDTSLTYLANKSLLLHSPGISHEVQQLLKACELGEEEEALIKLLQGLGLSPIHTRTHTITPSLSPSSTASQSSDCTPAGQTDTSGNNGVHGNTGIHGNAGNHGNNSNHSNIAVLNTLHSGQTMLHIAVQYGHANVVQVLLQYGADPAIK